MVGAHEEGVGDDEYELSSQRFDRQVTAKSALNKKKI